MSTHAGSPRNTSFHDVFFIIIAAVGVLLFVAWMLPPIAGPRGASHRTQCKNNLKQIAMALHSYHDV
jgi:hypothetical protein